MSFGNLFRFSLVCNVVAKTLQETPVGSLVVVFQFPCMCVRVKKPSLFVETYSTAFPYVHYTRQKYDLLV